MKKKKPWLQLQHRIVTRLLQPTLGLFVRWKYHVTMDKFKEYKREFTDEEMVLHAWDKEMIRLSGLAYTGEDFEPNIKARDPRTVQEFVKLTGGTITQTGALAAIRRVIDKNATIITAGGSLPSCMQRMWTTDKRGGYHAESLAGAPMAFSIHPKIQKPLKNVEKPYALHIDEPIAEDVLTRLSTVSEFVRAYEPDGMQPEEFVRYGVVQKTLAQFIAAWSVIEEYKI